MPADSSNTHPKGEISTTYRSFLIPIIAFDLLMIGAMMLRAINRGKSPMRYFGETGLISWFSCIQLLVVAALSLWIFLIRKPDAPLKWTSPRALWRWMAIGGLFLAIDEIAQLHEMMDFGFHALFNIQENGITDRLDDLIVLLYIAAGGYLLYRFQQEFRNYRPAFKLVLWAFGLAGIMVLLDLITNLDPESNLDAFKVFFADLEARHTLLVWLQAIEEGFKVLAEGVFISALVVCLQVARRIDHQHPTPISSSEP